MQQAFLAKIYTYALNGYCDAAVSDALVRYSQHPAKRRLPRTTDEHRALALLEAAEQKKLDEDISYCIGLAYGQYYINGLLDILYAELLWTFLPNKSLRAQYETDMADFRRRLHLHHDYSELKHLRLLSFCYWPLVVINPWVFADSFAKSRFQYTGHIRLAMLRKASLAVQRANRRDNAATAHSLGQYLDSDDPKVIFIRQIAERSALSGRFIRMAARTEASASRWDQLFIRMFQGL